MDPCVNTYTRTYSRNIAIKSFPLNNFFAKCISIFASRNGFLLYANKTCKKSNNNNRNTFLWIFASLVWVFLAESKNTLSHKYYIHIEKAAYYVSLFPTYCYYTCVHVEVNSVHEFWVYLSMYASGIKTSVINSKYLFSTHLFFISQFSYT